MMRRESFERSCVVWERKLVDGEIDVSMVTYIALAAPMRQRQMWITMCCVALLLDTVKRNESLLIFWNKNSNNNKPEAIYGQTSLADDGAQAASSSSNYGRVSVAQEAAVYGETSLKTE